VVGDANGTDVAVNLDPFVVGGVFDGHGDSLEKLNKKSGGGEQKRR
jgi:hypothetical protein